MWTAAVTLVATMALAAGHGTVRYPPARGSKSIANSDYSKIDYDLVGSNCGGIQRQHNVNGGKCGICGDPYDASRYFSRPRDHERGGRFDVGTITASFKAGDVVSFSVEITAHHKGSWEFKLCPDSHSIEQACFDAHPVELEAGGTKYYPLRGNDLYEVAYRLPEDLTCENCVLQWRYTAANNWGYCNNGTGALGCGPQETFGACSDITITEANGGPSSNHDNKIPEDSVLLKKLGKTKHQPKKTKFFAKNTYNTDWSI